MDQQQKKSKNEQTNKTKVKVAQNKSINRPTTKKVCFRRKNLAKDNHLSDLR
jgi:hypothetical protein